MAELSKLDSRQNGLPHAVSQQRKVLRTPVMLALTVVGAIITLGTLVSLIFNTSLHTSAMTAAVPSHRDFWFAAKSNPFNVYFVKLGWAWTTFFFILHLISTAIYRPSTQHPATHRAVVVRRFTKYLIASLIWFGFQFWFNSHVFQLSGGTCALRLPDGLMDADDRWLSLPGIGAQKVIHKGGDGLLEPASAWLPISNEFCRHRLPISDASRPELRDALEDLVAAQGEETKLFLVPSLRGGIDISGHVFLLTLSTALIFDDLAPTIRACLRDGWNALAHTDAHPGVKAAQFLAKTVGLALLALWAWMLLVTSIFFHSPTEKFSGFFVGVLGAYAFKLLPSIIMPYLERLNNIC